MNHPLDGARLKVIRAKEHFDAFKDEIRAYMDRRPYEIPIKMENNKITVGSVFIKIDPPSHLCAVLGDCISNLRSSLEYVAWQLAVQIPRRIPTDKEARRIGFPIIAKDKGESALFDHQAWQQLVACAVPTDVLDIIKQVQPYHARNEALGWLSILANEDKHRLPLLTIALIDEDYWRDVMIIVRGTYTSLAASRGPGEIIASNASHKAAGPGLPDDPTGKVHVDCEPTVYVSLQNPSVPKVGVDVVFGKIIECVADIIPRFETFV